MTRIIYLLNGPNINLLGKREPHLYGRHTLADIEAQCRVVADRHDLELISRQTHAEHQMIDWLHEAGRSAAGIVINPAAFSYHSVAIRDALEFCKCPIVEVHITNIHSRNEDWRANSIMSAVVTGVITGLGTDGYRLAMEHLVKLLAQDPALQTGEHKL
jgi:3-dehydroquinate dehydratase-2